MQNQLLSMQDPLIRLKFSQGLNYGRWSARHLKEQMLRKGYIYKKKPDRSFI